MKDLGWYDSICACVDHHVAVSCGAGAGAGDREHVCLGLRTYVRTIKIFLACYIATCSCGASYIILKIGEDVH